MAPEANLVGRPNRKAPGKVKRDEALRDEDRDNRRSVAFLIATGGEVHPTWVDWYRNSLDHANLAIYWRMFQEAPGALRAAMSEVCPGVLEAGKLTPLRVYAAFNAYPSHLWDEYEYHRDRRNRLFWYAVVRRRLSAGTVPASLRPLRSARRVRIVRRRRVHRARAPGRSTNDDPLPPGRPLPDDVVLAPTGAAAR